ncbi:MAG: hypothetical protein GQ529_02180 [Methyloprofundus sp.]|nr:hypothetical protein [Methyloprofundus sp.]
MTNGAVSLPQKAQHFPGMGTASSRFWVTVIFIILSILASWDIRHRWSWLRSWFQHE